MPHAWGEGWCQARTAERQLPTWRAYEGGNRSLKSHKRFAEACARNDREHRLMPRDRQRVPLESGPKLDLNRLIGQGYVRPGAHTRSSIRWTESFCGDEV